MRGVLTMSPELLSSCRLLVNVESLIRIGLGFQRFYEGFIMDQKRLFTRGISQDLVGAVSVASSPSCCVSVPADRAGLGLRAKSMEHCMVLARVAPKLFKLL